LSNGSQPSLLTALLNSINRFYENHGKNNLINVNIYEKISSKLTQMPNIAVIMLTFITKEKAIINRSSELQK